MIELPATLMKPEAAEALAKTLNEDDLDAWTYTAVHAPGGKGWSFIEIHDEAGHLVGKI